MSVRFRAVAIAALAPVAAQCAVFTTKLQPDTVAAWEEYVERFERAGVAGRPMLDVSKESPVLMDLNPNGGNASEDVPNGYIHHWIGAIRIANATVADVQGVLEDYEHYSQTYSPDLRLASASRVSEKQYDVRLVTERVEGLGIHFAFDIRSRVVFHHAMDDYALIDSRSYSIRESDSGRAPYTDLRPEGQDHGILWRLNSYWRLRQSGASVYAECQVISLSRKPLFGMNRQVKGRAKDSLETTLRQTRSGALRHPRAQGDVHAFPRTRATISSMARITTSGRSSWIQCPAPETISTRPCADAVASLSCSARWTGLEFPAESTISGVEVLSIVTATALAGRASR